MKSIVYGLLAAGAISAQATAKLQSADYENCPGIMSAEPERMYDFKLGTWTIHWRNKTGPETITEFNAVSVVTKIMDGDIIIDEQVADYFKGITFRTYDASKKEWVVRWLPAGSAWLPAISAKLENCVPVERHEQLTGSGQLAVVRTSFTEITENRFEFHQDWSMDGGESWIEDVLYYEAVRDPAG